MNLEARAGLETGPGRVQPGVVTLALCNVLCVCRISNVRMDFSAWTLAWDSYALAAEITKQVRSIAV